MTTTRLVSVFALALLLASCSPEQQTLGEHRPGFLHAEGTKIVDGQGEEVILRGIGLGGWMLQEGYMMHTGGPQYRIEAKIEGLVGPERTQEFYDAWLANHTRREDVAALANWGFNSIRLPMHYQLFTPPLDKGFQMVDELLEWAGDHEMYLILDMHAAPGGQGKNADINDYDPEKPSLWESEANLDELVAIWRQLAERYSDEPWIGGYDLINEPNWGFADIESDPNGCDETRNAPLWQLQQRINEAIREVDSNHLVFIEGNCWGNNYKSLPPLWDDNLAISFHKYWNFNDQDSIQWALDLRAERGVPLWLGESGENSNTWFTDAIGLVESHGIGWAWWPLKKQGFNNPLEIVINPGYQRLIDYWKALDAGEEVERPTGDEAFAALMQLTENLRIENNRVHRDVIDAMIRQPHTDETLPFRRHVISADKPTEILAVDFDLGRNGHAYSDTTVANYRVSTGGPWVAWNEGRAYRNDGVDIAEDPESGYYVGWTELGEWLQFTVEVEDEGLYTVDLVSSEQGDGVSLEVDGDRVTSSTVLLRAGTRRLRVLIDQSGVDVESLTLSPQKSSSP